MNVQFAIKKDEIYVIEVIKGQWEQFHLYQKLKVPLAKIASRVMAGEKLSKFNLDEKSERVYAVKESVFLSINFLIIYF